MGISEVVYVLKRIITICIFQLKELAIYMSEKIKVTLPGNIIEEVDKGTTVPEIIKTSKEPGQPLAAIINGEIRELFRPLYVDSKVIPINRMNRIGYSIYARTLSYLFVLAAKELFPDKWVVIDHAINDEIYGLLNGEKLTTQEDIESIKQRMQEIIDEDARIEKVKVTKEEAIEIFKSNGAYDKLSLIKNAKDYSHIWLYRCRGYYDYFYGPMVPSMGYTSFGMFPAGWGALWGMGDLNMGTGPGSVSDADNNFSSDSWY